MKQQIRTEETSRSAQITDAGYFNDFEAWLGYEFWSSQVEVDAEQEQFDFGAEGFIHQSLIMEIQHPYQMSHAVPMQKERGNDALPF